jgi:outer membrane protein TolC
MLLSKQGQMILFSGILISSVTGRAETIEDAWRIAIDHNHQIKSAQADTSASEQQLYSAQGQRLPELNVGVRLYPTQ